MTLINRYHPLPLVIFAIGDVILYDIGLTPLQLAFAIFSYLFVIISFLKSCNIGILYFISFNILTIGLGNYWGNISAMNYWGLRLGPVSVNIILSIVFTLYLCVKKNMKNLLSFDIFSRFFMVFILYSFIIGLLFTIIGYNYVDNFLQDTQIFLPIIFYIIIIKDLNLSYLNRLIKYTIPITLYSLVLAYIFNKRAAYSSETFLIGNTFSYIAPFGILILRKFFSLKAQLIYISIYIFFMCSMSILLGGKTIIGYIALLLWWASLNDKWRIFNWITILVGIPLIIIPLEYLTTNLESGIIAFKISQVISIFSNPDFFKLATEYSSVGNLIAEAITLFTYLHQNLIFLMIGKGFGGGIPDIFGFLTPFAGAAGYPEVDAIRNNFFNLHLAPYKIFIDGGIFIFCYYIKILYKILSLKTAISFLAFLMMIFYFYVSKEFMLLTFVFLRICVLSKISNRQIDKKIDKFEL